MRIKEASVLNMPIIDLKKLDIYINGSEFMQLVTGRIDQEFLGNLLS
jgi:hypothetical protein